VAVKPLAIVISFAPRLSDYDRSSDCRKQGLFPIGVFIRCAQSIEQSEPVGLVTGTSRRGSGKRAGLRPGTFCFKQHPAQKGEGTGLMTSFVITALHARARYKTAPGFLTKGLAEDRARVMLEP
jgi:hypothetical protein